MSYYDVQGHEVIDVIRQVTMGLDGFDGFCLGNVVKYVMRAGEKDGEPFESDIRKAHDYAHMLVYGRWADRG